jgi:CelD/BcsL family acetyltransferase involved in cellulose biosynthesis
VTGSFTVVEARSIEEAAPYRAGWDRLATMRRWPFAELAWVEASARHLTPRARVFLVVVLRGSDVAAAMALAGSPRSSGTLTSVGAEALYEATPLLCDGVPATTHLLAHLLGRRRPMVLSRLLDSGTLEQCLREVGRTKGKTMTLAAPGAPYLTLAPTVESFVMGLSSNRRSALNRKRRKLESRGSVEFHSDYPSETAVLDALREFEQLEAAGWKGRRGSAIVERPGLHDFFAAALPAMARDDRVRVDRVTVGETLAAIQFGLVSGNRYFLIKPTYDEALQDYSPGNILTFEAIKLSIAQGLETYEFLGSEDPWKMQWTTSMRASSTWVHYPYNIFGLARFGLDALHAMKRRMARQNSRVARDTDS